jgi:hypothetical protein
VRWQKLLLLWDQKHAHLLLALPLISQVVGLLTKDIYHMFALVAY